MGEAKKTKLAEETPGFCNAPQSKMRKKKISHDYRTWRVTCIPYVSMMLYDIMYKRSNSPHPLTLVILLGKCRKYLVVRTHLFSPFFG